MKYLKRILLVLLALFLLAGISVFVVITFYKKEIAVILTDNLRTNYGLHLAVEDVDVSLFSQWPHASVKLKKVVISNRAASEHGTPLLKAGSLSLSLNLENVLRRKFVVNNISLKNAELFLIREADGRSNFEFKKAAPAGQQQSSAIDFDLRSVTLERVNFVFQNKGRGQHLAVDVLDMKANTAMYADGLKADIAAKVLVGQLLFNPRNGAFLKNTRAQLNLQLHYLAAEKSLCIYPSSYAEMEAQRFNTCCLLRLDSAQKLDLVISGKQFKFERVAALLTPKIKKVLSNFEVLRPLDASILIHVNLGKREEPLFLAEVIGKDCDLAIGNSKIPYSGLYFKGKITCMDATRSRGDIARATIKFDPLKGKIYDFPFTASVTVNNLQTPSISINASLLLEAKRIKTHLAKDFELKGSALATIHYQGPTNKLNAKEFLQAPMKLQAYLLLNEFSYKEIDRPYVYALSGKAAIDNQNLSFEQLKLKTDFAEATLKGQAQGFVNYALGYTKGFKASLNARTPFLDLNPVLLAGNTEKNSGNAVTDNKRKISESHFEFLVKLQADQLRIRKVEASDAALEMHYHQNTLNITSLNVRACDGRIKAKATIKDFSQINSTFAVEQVNVNKLFTQFENFGQTAIVSDNLRGSISLDGHFNTELSPDMQIKTESMAGEVKLKLKDGHLLNFEPVQNLSNFLFKNRDFNDVAFTDLTETFKLRGYEMKIEELEIGSSLLNLYVVNGLYHFKGNSNINILVPWSNLRKRGKNYIPKNSGESAENTKGLKLNFSGPSKNMKISLGHKEQEKRFW